MSRGRRTAARVGSSNHRSLKKLRTACAMIEGMCACLNGPAQGRQRLRSSLSHVGSDATKAAAGKLPHLQRPPLSS